MKAMRRQWRTGAALVVGLGLSTITGSVEAAPAIPPGAQVIDARDLMARLQRLERDLRDVQAETFKKPPGTAAAAPAGASAPAAAAAGAAAAGAAAAGTVASAIPAPEAQPQQMLPDLNPLIRRMDELEDGITRLTGQMEEIGHQVDQLAQKTDRLQKQLDYQAMQTSAPAVAAAAPAPAAGAPTPGPDTLASLTPPEGTPNLRGTPPANLGQIPANAPLPAPRPADAKGEFDTAMTLLSRAQYDPARDAFRKFADAHPEDDRAADALYWTGDIAYSAKKDYPGAARDFAELLKKYPKAQRAPEGMLKLGLALFELGQMKEGCAALVALPAKYPDATPAVAARARTERTSNKCK